jgi:glycosyltransferase involved in cell wall biosynthesis
MNDQSLMFAPSVILIAGLDNDGGSGISFDQAVLYKMMSDPNVKIVLRVNENDARKGTNNVDKTLVEASKHIDGTVFVSRWLQSYFAKKKWKCKNQTVIVNGVAADVFSPQPKLNNGKINIVTHHWSDNEMKGADYYELIDDFVGKNSDKFSFTYIGRHKCDFKNTTVIRPLHGKALGDELGKYDVYVSASRFDPGPNHITEAISCGLPTYVHKDGGGAVEFAGNDHVFSSYVELEKLLLNGEFKPNQTTFAGWGNCIESYVRYLETVCMNNIVIVL